MFNECPTKEQLADACMWERHDFGLLSTEDRRELINQMKLHWRAVWKACNTPGRGGEFVPPND